MSIQKALIAGVAVLALAGCPDPDEGGGGGLDGTIAFIRGGRLTVSAADGSGGGEQFLTPPDTSADPALSPTGRTIAFAYSATPQATSRGIFTVPTAGGDPTELASPSGPGETFSSPSFSPAGDEVVFVSTSGAETRLFRVSLSGGAPERIAPAITDANFPVFLNDGTLLIVQGLQNQLRTLALTGGDAVDVGVSTVSRPAVARGGNVIAYASSDDAIHVRDLTTQVDTKIASTGLGDVKPAFSPDGSLVGFEAAGKLYQAAADGSGSWELLQSGTDVAWGP